MKNINTVQYTLFANCVNPKRTAVFKRRVFRIIVYHLQIQYQYAQIQYRYAGTPCRYCNNCVPLPARHSVITVWTY